jgi:hypothetical protein
LTSAAVITLAGADANIAARRRLRRRGVSTKLVSLLSTFRTLPG